MSLICPICQDNLINGESIDNYVNKCGHVYHSACLLPWWDSAPESNCPECRQPCNMDTITKIFLTVDHTEVINDQSKDISATFDLNTQVLVHQIKEHIDVQTYTQTKDINDKFRQQNSDFSTLLLNSNHRLTTNYNDKLSAVSKELTEVITDEHNRLLTQLDAQPRPANSKSYNITNATDHLTDDIRSTKSGFCSSFLSYWQSKPASYIASIIAILCLFAIIIAVIVYSHLILQAVKSSESIDQLKTNNVSLRLEMLNQELNHIANGVSQDIKIIKFDLENLRESIKKGINSNEIGKRLGEVSRKEDELLLEQIQTDRRVNLKLDVVHNSIIMLKTQIESINSTDFQEQSINRIKLRQLEEQNEKLEAKLEHLQSILTEGRNLNAIDVVKQIENDNQLSAQTGRDEKSIWEQPGEVWHKFTDAIGVKSSSVGITAKVTWVFLCTFSTMFVSIFIF